MDDTIFGIPLWVITVGVVVALVLLVAFGVAMYFYLRKPETVEERPSPPPEIPASSYELHGMLSGRGQARLNNSIFLVLVGTFGANQGARLLRALYISGLAEHIGAILVVELDGSGRANFENETPDCYTGRICYAEATNYAGGLGNREPEEVMEPRVMAPWIGPVAEAIETATNTHVRLTGGSAPAVILEFISPGGHLEIGRIVTGKIRKKFEQAYIVGCSVLADKTPQRQSLVAGMEPYKQSGLDVWLLIDNLPDNQYDLDYYQVLLFVGILSAAEHRDDRANHLNNVFKQVGGKEKGRVLTLHAVYDHLVAQRLHSTPPRYYVNADNAKNETLKLFYRAAAGVTGDIRRAVAMPVGQQGTACKDIVLLPFKPDDVLSTKDKVEASRREVTIGKNRPGMTWTEALERQEDLVGCADYETLYAPYAVSIKPSDPVAPIVLLRLLAIQDDDPQQMLAQLPQQPHLRKPTTALPLSVDAQPTTGDPS